MQRFLTEVQDGGGAADDGTRQLRDLVWGAMGGDDVQARVLQAVVRVYAGAPLASVVRRAGCCQRHNRTSPATPNGSPIPLSTHSTQVTSASTAPQSCFRSRPTTASPCTTHSGIEKKNASDTIQYQPLACWDGTSGESKLTRGK